MIITCKFAQSGPANAIYKIVSKNTGKVAGVLPGFGAFASFSALGSVDASSSSLDQQFIVTKSSGDYYKIAPKSNPNLYLTATIASLNYPICLHTPYDDSYPADQWKFISAGNGDYYIQSRMYGTSVFQVGTQPGGTQEYIYEREQTSTSKELFILQKVGCLSAQSNGFRVLASASAAEPLDPECPDPTIDPNASS